MSSNKTTKTKVAIFKGKKIRRHWDEKAEKWYFSVVDVVGVLTNSTDARNYWKVLKNRLKNEGSEVVTKCNQLKMQAADGKFYSTDAADTEIMLRIIQSIPSPNAEPFKLWLARVGYERIEETHDPELAINRALNTYLKKGYSESWINQRLKSIEIRKALTDEWEKRGVKKGDEIGFAYWLDRDYKGKGDDVSAPFYLYHGELSDFRNLCGELDIDIVEYPACAYCCEPIFGSFNFGEKGNKCFDCEKAIS